ncbi:sodium/bile acid cotransporter-like isoform X2 [Archocentrus centrarchus]|uniref:sodium/bile acid cotransporter-like isoform X2 n=1 Tax=Archocentrus centrarchus TaxID=63155 RepID=UPI0011E9EF33|nr:sodium/bile acid cotransporter-like isoform X2 [Archocentrus centrarchus]
MNNTTDLITHPDLWLNMTAVNTTSVYYPVLSSAMNKAISIIVIIVIFITMISLGCTMKVSQIKYHLMKPKGVAIAVVAQYGIMPLTAFCLAKVFQFGDITAVVVLICGCCPGGALSNTLTLALQGDMNLSIVMTSCSTLLALGMMPLLLFLYCQGFPNMHNTVPYVEITVSLVMMLVPCGIGILINAYRPQYSKMITKVGITIMVIFGVVTLTLTSIGLGGIIVALLSPPLLATAALMPLIGYSFGYIISAIFRLSQVERRTISMETGCQNIQLCTTILKIAFPQEVIGPLFLFPTVYVLLQLLEAVVIFTLFRCYKRLTREDTEIYRPAVTGEDLKESTV